jgi:hypothetical protein
MNGTKPIGPTLVLAATLLLAAWILGAAFVRARTADRFVTVKGVAERVVDADVGLWPFPFVATDNDLTNAQAKIEAQRRTVMAFLQKNGLEAADAELQGLEVTDVRANPYQTGQPVGDRFIVRMMLMVRSDQPEKIRDASQKVGELVNSGVVLSSGPGGGPFGGPTFLFTKLNDLKPEMIAEATASARKAAEQFAKDSRSKIGGIRRASQGVFEILPRDQALGIMEQSQLHKTLRVVTTVDYFLAN